MRDDLMKRLHETLPGIETPLMRGDNFALLLCGHFDDGEPNSDNDSGWSDSAENGYNEVIAAIRAHYEPAAARIAELEARVEIYEASRDQWRASAEAELHLMRTAGMIELAVRNPSVADYMQHWEARAEAAEAQVAKLVEDAAFIQQQRASAMLRRNLNAPEDVHVQTLCERYGYGAVMDAASRLWAREDSMGAFYIGGCIGMKTDAEARAAVSTVKREAAP